MVDRKRTAIVTGASGNLGSVVATTLVSSGYEVAGVVRTGDSHPAGIEIFETNDLSDESDARDTVQAIEDAHGAPYGLVHTVGGFAMAKTAASDRALWEQMFSMNTLTAANMINAVLPSMEAARSGRIVVIGANAALHAPAEMAAYAGSKAALMKLVESAAREHAESEITINAILPSIIDTATNREAMPGADRTNWIAPEAIADAISFLLSDKANAISGAAIPMTGGYA